MLTLKFKELILPYFYTSMTIIFLSGVIAFFKNVSVWFNMREWALAALY